ncbi:hypothetical protein Tco_1043277 [Tanacetum coccineum]|uniref:Uncharacterized protein n=1 Tax=Tanacetum coccineum TaxID=301880 RepID=A0ABQ5GNS8_9ASTR
MINGKAAYELKGKFLEDLRDNAFSGTNEEDAVEHIENFLKIVDRLDFPNIQMCESNSNSEPLNKQTAPKAKWDSTDVLFENWLASKFTNHMTMDPYTKNALWEYWKKGDDQEIFLDLEETYEVDEDETYDMFDYETPLYKEYDELNYLFKIDTDLLTDDILGFITYDEFKNKWMDEWNKKAKWPTCNSNEDGFCNGGELLEMDRMMKKLESRMMIMELATLIMTWFRITRLIILTKRRSNMRKIEEKYIAIKECKDDDWKRTEEDVCHAYQGIFLIMDEGCLSSQTFDTAYPVLVDTTY